MSGLLQRLLSWLRLLGRVSKSAPSDESPFKPIGIGQITKQRMPSTGGADKARPPKKLVKRTKRNRFMGGDRR